MRILGNELKAGYPAVSECRNKRILYEIRSKLLTHCDMLIRKMCVTKEKEERKVLASIGCIGTNVLRIYTCKAISIITLITTLVFNISMNRLCLQ